MTNKRVCIVTNGIFGVPYDSEISIYYSELALFLNSSGYDVSILFANKNIEQYKEKISIINSFCISLNLKLFLLISSGDDKYFSDRLANENLVSSYKIYNWFKSQPNFDIIFFSDYEGFGFYSLLAKNQGLMFQNSKIIVKVFHPTSWKLFANKTDFDSLDYIAIDYIEKKSIELCDVLLVSSNYIVNWIKDNDWQIPSEVYMIWDIIYDGVNEIINIGNNKSNILEKENKRKHLINELVYYGNFEKQKNIDIFIDAIDIFNIKYSMLHRNLIVSFIFSGDKPDEDSMKNLHNRIKHWNFKINIIDSFDFNQSVKYLLQDNGKLLILPYLLENTPYIITKCLYYDIPFIVSDKIASLEYIEAEDVANRSFVLNKFILADKIHDFMINGITPTKSNYSIDKVKKDLIKCIEELSFDLKSSADLSLKPKVSVCLVHHERPHLLKYAVDSLRKQDYTNYEVILVDDGSRDRESYNYLNSLSEEFNDRGWKIIMQPNLHSSAARNRAAKEASGEYIVFLDDDDYVKPYNISTFIKAMINSKADVLTCFPLVFNSNVEPKDEDVTQIWIFTGDPASGIFENSYGPINAMFKKNVFFELGGFTELKGLGLEDWEIFANAVLNGYKLEVIPEPLFYYRIIKNSKNNVNTSTDIYYNNQRVLKPYLNAFGADMASAVMYLKNMKKLNYERLYLNNYILTLKQNLKDKFNIII